MGRNIGFVSTRFAGTDGVTLESIKWAQIIKKSGHYCFWFAGELDRNPLNSFLVTEAFFNHKDNKWINNQIFGKKRRSRAVTKVIHSSRSFLKAELYEFIKKFKIDMLIAENALTIPLHVPLGLALTEIIAETQIPTIAHHHDFYWERVRFTVNAVNDYIHMAFPPTLPNIEHVVINSAAKEELAHRTGVSSTIIPNVLDFENPSLVNERHTEDFRNSIGLKPDDVMILQPSRVIQRKGIEHAIELVHELKDSRYKLVISHEAGDEGFEYVEWLKESAKDHSVDLRLVDTSIADPVNDGLKSPNQYSLWDIYPHADFITYPSIYEGFGNALLETIYFRKPMLVNRYATFVRDIEPKGFELIVMDGFLTKKTVQKVREILESPEKKEKMVNHNYGIATRYYSYSVLRKCLNSLIINFFGIEL